MIRAIAIDDEPLALKLLELYIGRILDMELIAACTVASTARPLLGDADVLFVDINMPDVSGMEFVRSLENPPMVVFTTAYSEYAVEGFRVNAVDYLVKPFSFEEFAETVGRVRRMLEMKALQGTVPAADKVIFFQEGRQKRRVPVDDILYVESMGAYLKVHIRSAEPFVVIGNFKGILETDPEIFLRIHKSHVVNLHHISRYGRASVTMENGTVLAVGEAYRKVFRELIPK